MVKVGGDQAIGGPRGQKVGGDLSPRSPWLLRLCKTAWRGTADFISLIIKLWNILNVKSCTKGKHKRNDTMDPIRMSWDWQLDFLKDFAAFVKRWEMSKQPGLTRESFLALQHTFLAITECATYMLDQLAFDVVLLGYLQSDPIESRFGWLRQLSGANYYISTKQALDSDRKIRAVSLLKFSNISLTEIDNTIQSSNSDSETCSTKYDSVADQLNDELSFDYSPSTSDLNIIYYVSGYIARSVCRKTRCDHCSEALSDSNDLPPVDFNDVMPYAARTFFDSVNRGGLKTPTEFVFTLTVHCWRVYEEILAKSDLKSQFLATENHSVLFYKIMDRASCHHSVIDYALNNYMCTQGHNLTQLVVQRFFNCVAKNLVNQLTTTANLHSEPASKKRKIDKLCSRSKD